MINLGYPATRQQSYYGLFSQAALRSKILETLIDIRPHSQFIDRRISYILHRIIVLGIKRNLERKNGIKSVYIPTDTLYPPFLPSPNLRRDIIINRNTQTTLHILGYFQIETRIIYQYNHIGTKCGNILFTQTHVRQNFIEIHQHRNKSHISHIPIMLYQRTATRSHQVTAEKTKFGVRIFLLQGSHQIGGM